MIIDKNPWIPTAGVPFSGVDINSVGTHLATASLDNRVRVFNLAPVLDASLESDQNCPRLLATLVDHSGPVNAVRFAHGGKALASAADDKTICVYDLVAGGGKQVLGGERNVENWQRRNLPLRGHDNNVTDVDWSHDDSLLASCSLDNHIIVWDAATGKRVATLAGHASYAKGVRWDPIGKYLASQSDDSSLILWRTDDWTPLQRITKPFTHHVSSTFSLRCDWSPTGDKLVAVNACQRPHHVALCFERAVWDAPYQLVGHLGPVVCARFSPRLYFARGAGGGPNREEAGACVALGGTDGVVSVWLLNNTRAVMAGRKICKSVCDVAWTPDGYNLVAVSTDTSLVVLQFQADELGEAVPLAEQQELTRRMYGGHGVAQGQVFAESASQLQLEGAVQAEGPTQDPTQGPAMAAAGGAAAPMEVDPALAPPGGVPQPNAPEVPPAAQAAVAADAPTAAAADPPPGGLSRSNSQVMAALASRIGNGPVVAGLSRRSVPTAEAPSGGSKLQGAAPPTADAHTVPAPSTSQEHAAPPAASTAAPVPVARAVVAAPAALAVPAVQRRVAVKLGVADGVQDGVRVHSPVMLEAHNPEGGGRAAAELLCSCSGRVLWRDHMAGQVVRVAGSLHCAAVATRDGGLQVYSAAGRRLLPMIRLSAPAVHMASNGSWRLVVVSADGEMKVLDVQAKSCELRASVSPLLTMPPQAARQPPPSLVRVSFSKHGAPLAVLSTRHAYIYHTSLQSWVALADGAFGMSMFASRLPPSTGELSALQAAVTAGRAPPGGGMGAAAERQAIDSRGHLEATMAAALALGNAEEYKDTLLAYVGHLTAMGEEGRLRELCNELLGPSYASGTTAVGAWAPTVLGLNKRELLRAKVLPAVGRRRDMQRVALEFTDLLEHVGGNGMEEGL